MSTKLFAEFYFIMCLYLIDSNSLFQVCFDQSGNDERHHNGIQNSNCQIRIFLCQIKEYACNDHQNPTENQQRVLPLTNDVFV